MGTTDNDLVILVDESDQAIGTAGKLAAHQDGQLHRAISVLVLDPEGRLLLQKRATGKYHSASLWTNTCCSHPRPGEPVAEAAVRRLDEEMGFATELQPLFVARYRADVSNHLIENEIVHVFGGRGTGPVRPDPAEVADWRWVTIDEVVADAALRPEDYTVWFRKYLNEFREKLEPTAELRGA